MLLYSLLMWVLANGHCLLTLKWKRDIFIYHSWLNLCFFCNEVKVYRRAATTVNLPTQLDVLLTIVNWLIKINNLCDQTFTGHAGCICP